MDFLDIIPAGFFETAGLIVGLGANIVIGIQVFKEFKSHQPSSLSLGYVIGWWLIFVFWFFYGIRFDAVAITISNGLATLIQTILIFVVIRKKKTDPQSL
ncbi:MAG: hypothetical protein IPK35_15670 [Saprospiraceae bacterium]|jgi:uncharacterized protein with PQ loop repeat|nr:hypothetical protein [Saprospiraceae bacterium]